MEDKEEKEIVIDEDIKNLLKGFVSLQSPKLKYILKKKNEQQGTDN